MTDTTVSNGGDSVRRAPNSTSKGHPGSYRSSGPPDAKEEGRERGEQNRRSVLRIEDATEVKVGNFYDVPWIRLDSEMHHFIAGARIPVLGDEHNDKELIGFPFDHWHIDWRFADLSTWNQANGWAEYCGAHPDKAGIVLAKIVAIQGRAKLTEQGRGTMRCYREHPVFPVSTHGTVAPWKQKLEDAYAHASAKCGLCPHRGISLAGAPIENGARTCPGHGLSWHLETGELVRRAV